jgi:hypothetical protein
MTAFTHTRQNEPAFHVVDEFCGIIEHCASFWFREFGLHPSEAGRKAFNGI